MLLPESTFLLASLTNRSLEGIAYPLYFNFIPTYLAKKYTAHSSLSITYRNYCIQSIVSVFGPLSAAVLVNTRFGRRWMLGASAIVSGIFLFAYTAADNSAGDLAFSCITGLFGNFGKQCPFTIHNSAKIAFDLTFSHRIRHHVCIHT